MTPTLADFRRHVLDRVVAVGQNLEPDGDWQPMLLMDTPEALEIAPMLGAMQEDPRLVASLVAQRKARLVAMVRSAWEVSGEPGREILRGDAPRPADNPNREEIVMVFTASATGDYTDKARILRGSGPPKLGKWERSTASTGPFVDMIRAAIQVGSSTN